MPSDYYSEDNSVYSDLKLSYKGRKHKVKKGKKAPKPKPKKMPKLKY